MWVFHSIGLTSSSPQVRQTKRWQRGVSEHSASTEGSVPVSFSQIGHLIDGSLEVSGGFNPEPCLLMMVMMARRRSVEPWPGSSPIVCSLSKCVNVVVVNVCCSCCCAFPHIALRCKIGVWEYGGYAPSWRLRLPACLPPSWCHVLECLPRIITQPLHHGLDLCTGAKLKQPILASCGCRSVCVCLCVCV